MNWDAIGASAEVIGVVTILLSLIYVAVQIRQSNKIAQGEAERDLHHHWMQGLESLVADKWTTETFLRGLADFDSLTSVEKTRLSYKLIELNVIYAAMLELNEKGMVSKKLTDRRSCLQTRVLRTVLAHDLLRLFPDVLNTRVHVLATCPKAEDAHSSEESIADRAPGHHDPSAPPHPVEQELCRGVLVLDTRATPGQMEGEERELRWGEQADPRNPGQRLGRIYSHRTFFRDCRLEPSRSQ